MNDPLYLLERLYELTIALESTSISIELLNHRGFKCKPLITYSEWLLECIDTVKNELIKTAPAGFDDSWIEAAEDAARKVAL